MEDEVEIESMVNVPVHPCIVSIVAPKLRSPPQSLQKMPSSLSCDS
jgi:hypothetical protein